MMISFGVMSTLSSFQFSSLCLCSFNFIYKPCHIRAKGNRPSNDTGMIVYYRLKSGTELINSMISMESFR